MLLIIHIFPSLLLLENAKTPQRETFTKHFYSYLKDAGFIRGNASNVSLLFAVYSFAFVLGFPDGKKDLSS